MAAVSSQQSAVSTQHSAIGIQGLSSRRGQKSQFGRWVQSLCKPLKLVIAPLALDGLNADCRTLIAPLEMRVFRQPFAPSRRLIRQAETAVFPTLRAPW